MLSFALMHRPSLLCRQAICVGVVVVKILASHAVVQMNWKLSTAEVFEVISQLGPPEDVGIALPRLGQ